MELIKIHSNTVFKHGSTEWLHPVQLSADNLLKLGNAPKVLNPLINCLESITKDDYLEYMLAYYKRAYSLFGDSWQYCDLLTVLQAATSILKPENYLEIGVRRGRSLAVVASTYPSVNITGFDLWVQNYAGIENPGPEFVSQELQKVNHVGHLNLISGDSKQTVPQFLKANPDLYFDLITVDGDHSLKGARIDLLNVIPRLKIGGILLLDDISHPQHLYLEKLFDKLLGKNPQFDCKKYKELGYGIACAIRKSF